jgi:hypothetical protein
MSPSRIRGWAGLVFGTLGLLLARSGPGFAVAASAAPGCPDDSKCYTEISEEGWGGPTGGGVTSRTAKCVGPCDGGIVECTAMEKRTPGGPTTFYCGCELSNSPAECTGFTTVDSEGQVTEFFCSGNCDAAGATCKTKNYEFSSTPTCPTVYSVKTKCVCD